MCIFPIHIETHLAASKLWAQSSFYTNLSLKKLILKYVLGIENRWYADTTKIIKALKGRTHSFMCAWPNQILIFFALNPVLGLPWWSSG